jgi:hypothetical protein
MSKCTLRSIFTVLLYAGVGLFLYPYLTGHFSNAVIFLVAGIGLAVLCGILRCSFEEGDCTQERSQHPKHPRKASAHRLTRLARLASLHGHTAFLPAERQRNAGPPTLSYTQPHAPTARHYAFAGIRFAASGPAPRRDRQS